MKKGENILSAKTVAGRLATSKAMNCPVKLNTGFVTERLTKEAKGKGCKNSKPPLSAEQIYRR